MNILLITLLLGTLLLTTQASQVKRQRGESGHQLEKEENNKIYHGPAYKKALTDEEFARKKARYYKKLRLGHKGEHRPANTRHDQDNLSLQDLSAGHQVMKLKSLKPSKKLEKKYKKLLAKEKLRLKKKQFKKAHKSMTP